METPGTKPGVFFCADSPTPGRSAVTAILFKIPEKRVGSRL